MPAIVLAVALVLVIVLAVAERIASEAGMSRVAAVAADAMPLVEVEVVPEGGITEPAHVPTAAAALPAWERAEAGAAEEAAVGAGRAEKGATR